MAGLRKEHDWFAESLANPSFSNTDFKSVGINASNTSLGPVEVYLNSPDILKLEVFKTNGLFDLAKVRAYYMNVARSYNNLAKDTYELDLDADKSAIFSLYNFFVSPEKRTDMTPATIYFKPNPDHATFGFSDFNTPGKITKTPEELSESQPIWDPDTKTWSKETPEDSFFKNFFRPTVLATWDYDADINGNPTSDPSKIAFYKGLPKVNEFGEYYQEFLNGRSSDGKQLLHKTNILTREDSWLNEYDPFDNDGFDKSVWGSITLNAIKIVPLFIPYVREAYMYTNLGLGAALALTTLGRMFSGSDNAFLNTASSVMESFHTTPSQYAMQHAFSLENTLNMVGDTFEFIKSQRLLAEKAPQWFGSKVPKNSDEFNAKVNEMVATKMRNYELRGLKKDKLVTMAKTFLLESSAELQQLILNYQKLGQLISRNYMAITFGTHTYNTAKALGVSDRDATLLTLGAIGGLYVLLGSHIGKWVFPEAKLEAQEIKFIIKNTPEVIESESFKAAHDALDAAVTVGEKIKSVRDMFNVGKSLVSKVYDSPMKTTAQAVVASSIASGVEMTSFTVLDDIIAATYNIALWLGGNDHRMSAWENMGERYLTSFLGGAFAGTLASKELYKAAKGLHSLSPEQAFEKMVAVVASGKKDKLLKELDSATWGNKYLSTESYFTADEIDSEIYKQGTEINNQDKLIKDAVRNEIEVIDYILKTNDAKIDPMSLIKDDKIVGLVKTSLLQGSVVVKDFIGNLNKKLARLVEVQLAIKSISDTLERKLEKEIEKEKKDNEGTKLTKLPINELDNLLEERKKLILEIHKYKTGEIMQEYIPWAIFDLSPGLNSAYINGNFASYTERTYNKGLTELNTKERAEAVDKYKKWIEENKLTASRLAYDLFSRINPVVSLYLGKLKKEGVFKDLDLGQTKALKHLTIENRTMLYLMDDSTSEFIDTNAKLAAGSTDFKENIRKDIVNSIILEINSKGNKEDDRQLIENLRTALRNDLFKDKRELLERFVDALEVLLYRKDILEALDSDLKDRKFIDYELKRTLKEILLFNLNGDDLRDQIFGEDQFELDKEELGDLFSNYDVAKLTNLDALQQRLWTLDIVVNEKHKEQTILENLNKISDFDLLDTISSFGKEISKDSIDLKVLFGELNQVFTKNQKTIDKFFLGQDKLNQIEMASLVLEMFKNSTVATNNVVDNIENIIGYNVTVNAFNKNNELTVLDPKYVAKLLNTLDLISTKLNYYLTLAEYARSNKFNLIANVENDFRVTLYKQLKDKLDKIPTSWKDKDVLKQKLDGLTDLQRLSTVKFSSLGSEALVKLILDYVKFEKAIHDFFLSNMVNIENTDELVKFIENFDLLNLAPSAIDEQNFKDDQSLLWYIASIAALDPQKFYSNFVNAEIKGIAPTFSRMTLSYLIIANLANRPIFDKFKAAHNLIVDKQLMRISPSKYKFDGRRIKYDNIVFLQSGAGAGKSFAILPLTLNLIKLINPKLLDNIWVASTAPVDNQEDNTSAKKLIQNWNVNSKNAFTRHLLMKMISNLWHETLNSELELEVKDSDAEVDYDNGLEKYRFKLREDHKAKDLPKVIVIDEIADYSELDMELISRFAKLHNILVIAAGDLYQIGLIGKGEIEINGSKEENILYLSTGLFIHTFYNTANYRTENSLQDKNIIYDRLLLSLIKDDSPFDIPAYQFYVDNDKGLYGRLVFNRKLFDALKQAIDMLVRTSDKKKRIGYVYDSKDSEIYKYISLNYKNEFEFFYKYPVKGEEAQYYVYDLLNEPVNKNGDVIREVLAKTLYTVFTRSKLGSIFIKPNRVDVTRNLRSNKTDYVTIASLDFMQLQKYGDAIVETIRDIYPDPVKIEIASEQKKKEKKAIDDSLDDSTKKDKDLADRSINNIKISEEEKDDEHDDSIIEIEEPAELSVSRKNVGFTLDDSDDVITIVEVDDLPVKKLLVTLNKAQTPVSKRFEYKPEKTRILLSLNRDNKQEWVDSDVTEVFNFGLYTRFNNYTGLILDEALGFKLSEPGDRIDNYYGLQNIFSKLGIPTEQIEDFTVENDPAYKEHNIIAKKNVQRFLLNIRELNYRIKDKELLLKEVVNLIKNTFGVELEDPYIRIMWESTAHDIDEYKETMFYRGKNETPDDPRLNFNSAKGFTMLLGATVNGEDEMLLTVPLAKLPHWYTVVKNTEGPRGDFLRELYDRMYEKTEKLNVPDNKFEYELRKNYLAELEEILKGTSTFKYSIGVASLYHLLKIYNFNHAGEVFMDLGTKKVNGSKDKAAVINNPFFTLAKDLETTGPYAFANERKGDVISDGSIDINERYNEEDIAEYFNIQDIVDAGLFTISPILVTKLDVKNDTDTILVAAGRPFILVGDSSLGQEELYSTWVALAHDNKLPIRVKRVYVKNPESNISDFIVQLERWASRNNINFDDEPLIGNDLTSYRILEHLKNTDSALFDNFLNEIFEYTFDHRITSIQPEILKLFELTNGITDSAEILKLLKSKSDYRNMTYGRLFNLALRIMIDPKWYEYKPDRQPIHLAMKAFIESELEAGRMLSIFYNIRFDKQYGEAVNGTEIFRIKTDSVTDDENDISYSIGNKPFTVNMIMTPVLTGDIYPLIAKISSAIKPIRTNRGKIIYSMSGTGPFTNNNARPKIIAVRRTRTEGFDIRVNKDKADELHLTYDNWLSLGNLDATMKRFRDNGYPAFKLGNTAYLLTLKPADAGTNKIRNINVVSDNEIVVLYEGDANVTLTLHPRYEGDKIVEFSVRLAKKRVTVTEVEDYNYFDRLYKHVSGEIIDDSIPLDHIDALNKFSVYIDEMAEFVREDPEMFDNYELEDNKIAFNENNFSTYLESHPENIDAPLADLLREKIALKEGEVLKNIESTEDFTCNIIFGL